MFFFFLETSNVIVFQLTAITNTKKNCFDSKKFCVLHSYKENKLKDFLARLNSAYLDGMWFGEQLNFTSKICEIKNILFQA